MTMEHLQVKFAPSEIDSVTGEFKGYGAVFGNIDSHGDVIMPGAFAETLAEWASKGRLPAMKLMHGSAINIFTGDDIPIGKWTVDLH
nr:HK97 family phage prohead protease [uncultured Shinella sp.]